MDDTSISTFCAFTSATPDQAQRYLALTDGNVEQAVELFYNSPDLGSAGATASPQASRQSNANEPITIGDDEDNNGEHSDDDDNDDDGDVQVTGSRATGANAHSLEDDEALARQLQEEMYGGGAAGQGSRGTGGEDVRAPMARTTETLVGPGSGDWRDDPSEMNVAISQQLSERQRRRAAPGIFNQRETASIWSQDEAGNSEAQREALSRATGGASDQSSKSNLLAALFSPPFDLIAKLNWSDARDEGKETEKWILINIQDPSIFDCQVLNRDIWKNPSIRETIKEHFIFMQYNKDDPRGQEYVNYYFSTMRDSDHAYPHISIVDPRTGEQVKVWSGSPAPKASDFLMDLHEFLDRYSLKMEKKNPVQTKRKESRKDVGAMSEEEMMEMALQNSLVNGSGLKEEDPDALTRPMTDVNGKGKAPAVAGSVAEASKSQTPFSRIPSSQPHEEPASTDPKATTRIQFRHSGGRIVRRFLLSDPVQRIYEWLKASPLEGKDAEGFELISMGKNLIDSLEASIGDAGLRNGTVMVEYVDDE